MGNKKLLNLLNDVQEGQETIISNRHDRVLIIDGLNLFFRNFAVMNMVNPDGVHVGGLGGFFRSLGAMIRQTNPTSVYVIFDGAGSTTNRKNLMSEYKGTRNLQRITNWDAFENLEEEHDAKIDQIIRIIQYLKLLPVKTTIIDKVEADDIIAVLSTKLVEKYDSTCFIVSSDKDFLQIVTDKIIVYRPMEKEFYNAEMVERKFGLVPFNFILYKTLLGDNSDNVPGIKGLGEKGIFKKFPELKTQKLTLEDIFDISEKKLKEHIIYARILQDRSRIETNYKVMDLSNPMVGNRDIIFVDKLIEENLPEFNPDMFVSFYNEDKLGGMIRNVDTWLKDIFLLLPTYKK